MFGCALPNNHFRQSFHPSRWLVVLNESFRYALHMIKGKLPTNHVSSKYQINSLMRGNHGATTSIACKAARTKQTGTNANAAVLRRSHLTFYWITPSPWTVLLFHSLLLHLPLSPPPPTHIQYTNSSTSLDHRLFMMSSLMIRWEPWMQSSWLKLGYVSCRSACDWDQNLIKQSMALLGTDQGIKNC